METRKDWIAILTFCMLMFTTIGTSIYKYSTINSKVEGMILDIGEITSDLSNQIEIDKQIVIIESDMKHLQGTTKLHTVKIDGLTTRTNEVQQQAALVNLVVEYLNSTLSKVNDTLDKLNDTVIIVNGDLKSIQKDVDELKRQSHNEH